MELRKAAVALVLALLLPSLATGQTEDTGWAVEVVSGDQGYRADVLLPGRYVLTIRLDGFEAIANRTTLNAGQVAAVDVILSPARFTEGWW